MLISYIDVSGLAAGGCPPFRNVISSKRKSVRVTDTATSDSLAEQWSHRIDTTYDCVDRIVLNGHCRHASSPGGFRCFWRSLFGTDDDLNSTRAMRLAGRFSRRLRAWATKNDIPVLNAWDYNDADNRMHTVAEDYYRSDPNSKGVFCITVHRAPGPVRKIDRYGEGGINIKTELVWVNHFAFHIRDPEWGHLTIKICGHPPFPAQISLNGHDYVASQLRSSNVGVTMEGNCFTNTSNAAALSQCADTLCCNGAIGRLRRACERWIYTCCLCFALTHEEQARTGFCYDYSVYQLEYSRNYLFSQGRVMEDIFQSLIDRSRRMLDLRQLKTIFGRRHRPYKKVKGKPPRFEVVVENPTYDLTVFKVHFERLTLKVYSKGARVLRFEAIAHNTDDLRCGKVLERWPKLIHRLTQMLDRFVSTLSAVNFSWIDNETLEAFPEPAYLGESRMSGIDLNKARMRAVLQAVLTVALAPRGFSVNDVAEKVRHATGTNYTPTQASYDLRKLRAKSLVERIPRTQRYRATQTGLRTIAAFTVLRENVLKPLLANECKLPKGPFNGNDIKRRYQNLRREMRELFRALGLAA